MESLTGAVQSEASEQATFKEEVTKELKGTKENGKAIGLIIHNTNATIAKDGVT